MRKQFAICPGKQGGQRLVSQPRTDKKGYQYAPKSQKRLSCFMAKNHDACKTVESLNVKAKQSNQQRVYSNPQHTRKLLYISFLIICWNRNE
jgi:hypothetical protein